MHNADYVNVCWRNCIKLLIANQILNFSTTLHINSHAWNVGILVLINSFLTKFEVYFKKVERSFMQDLSTHHKYFYILT